MNEKQRVMLPESVSELDQTIVLCETESVLITLQIDTNHKLSWVTIQNGGN